MIKINPFTISAIFTTLACLWVAGVFLIYGKTTLHRLWAIFNLCLVGWASFVILAVSSDDPNLSYKLWILAQTISIYISIMYLHTMTSFCKLNYKKLILTSYIYGIGYDVFLIIFSHDVYPGVNFLFDSMYYIEANKFISLLLLAPWFMMAIFSNYKLFKFYQQSSNPDEQEQARFLLIGGILGYSGGISTHLPMLGFQNFYPVTIIGVGIYCLYHTYAIFKHNLLNLKIIYQKSFIYTTLVAVISLVYLATVYIFENLIKNHFGYRAPSLSFLVAFTLGLLIIPARNKLQNQVDKYLFKGSPAQLSEENILLRQELHNANKLRTVAILASELAHEIKNPITTINTFAEYLPSKQGDIQFLNKCRQTLLHESARIQNLLGQLLSYAKPTPPNFETVNPQDILEDILILIEHKCLKQHIEIKKNYGAHQTILADPNQLKQAFLNIIMNAIESMPESGTLTIETAVNKNTYIISIKDTGAGIPKEDLSKIFTPFYTSKKGGTGLGLSITLGIIKDHGGIISVESKSRIGTLFKIELK